jgi:hypothetical protein
MRDASSDWPGEAIANTAINAAADAMIAGRIMLDLLGRLLSNDKLFRFGIAVQDTMVFFGAVMKSCP